MRRILMFLPLFCGLQFSGGCADGGFSYAPVNGTVTLNGKPVGSASVEFQPKAAKGGSDPGPGSIGITDKEGRFSLKSQLDPKKDGVVVGKHRVRIYVYQPQEAGGKDLDADSGKRKRTPNRVVIPARYSHDSTLELDIPPTGLKDYHFDLKSP